jgi:uncharacterized protein GlcG (DUF336 family)
MVQLFAYPTFTRGTHIITPHTFFILKDGGHPIVTKRADGCPAESYPKLANAKAKMCISVFSSSGAYGAKYLSPDATPDVYVRLLNQVAILQGSVAAFAGGVLVRETSTGIVLGAVAASGAAGVEDEYCVWKAIQSCSAAAQLTSDPVQHSCEGDVKKGGSVLNFGG